MNPAGTGVVEEAGGALPASCRGAQLNPLVSSALRTSAWGPVVGTLQETAETLHVKESFNCLLSHFCWKPPALTWILGSDCSMSLTLMSTPALATLWDGRRPS